MRNVRRAAALIGVGLLATTTMACGSEISEPESISTGGDSAVPPSAPSSEWRAVAVSEASSRLDASGADTITLIDQRAVGAALYRRRTGARPDTFAVLPSVVYHVIRGEAELVVGDSSAALTPGVTAFVRGRETRVVREVSEEVLLLALYTKARPGLNDPDFVAMTRDELLKTKSMNRNVLHRAVETESMTVGAFMLPREIGGDMLVRHGVDELKYVIRGGGTIVAGSDVVPVESGYVVFVDRSLTHNFTRLWRDLDVLFVWSR